MKKISIVLISFLSGALAAYAFIHSKTLKLINTTTIVTKKIKQKKGTDNIQDVTNTITKPLKGKEKRAERKKKKK